MCRYVVVVILRSINLEGDPEADMQGMEHGARHITALVVGLCVSLDLSVAIKTLIWLYYEY